MVLSFPPVEMADETGLLAIGGNLDLGTLEQAYRNGIFPWPVEGQPLLWFAPPKRAILEFDQLRIPDRLQRYLKKANFDLRVDSDFEGVIRSCARLTNRKSQVGTWITPAMMTAYTGFHKSGFAHSFEVFLKGEMVGGLYGVKIGKYFAGESMFYRISNASKFAFIQTVQYLRKLGFTWIDVQIQSPFLREFGVIEIPRDTFMARLKAAIE